jgi:hypothetical protein
MDAKRKARSVSMDGGVSGSRVKRKRPSMKDAQPQQNPLAIAERLMREMQAMAQSLLRLSLLMRDFQFEADEEMRDAAARATETILRRAREGPATNGNAA